MALEKAEFSGESGLIEIDVEGRDSDEAEEILEFLADSIEEEYDFDRLR